MIEDDDGELARRCGTLTGQGRAASWAEVGERLRRFTAECSVDRAVHFSLRSHPEGRGGLLQITTVSAEDGELTSRGEDVGFDDPLSELCDAARPMRWDAPPPPGDPLAEMIERMGLESGAARQGIAVPIHGPGAARGLFTVTSAESAAEWQEHGRRLAPWLQVFGWEFHRSVTRLLIKADGDGVTIPPREVAVLRSAADGRTAHDTALQLGLSVETVESYVRDAVRRLGCINKTHAVAVAVRRGLI